MQRFEQNEGTIKSISVIIDYKEENSSCLGKFYSITFFVQHIYSSQLYPLLGSQYLYSAGGRKKAKCRWLFIYQVYQNCDADDHVNRIIEFQL